MEARAHRGVRHGLRRARPATRRPDAAALAAPRLRRSRARRRRRRRPGAGSVRALLRREAREERVKSEAGAARIVHFATHGLYDPEVPFDSFLALSPPGGEDATEAEEANAPEPPDNGILQAWEISQELRLDADLVVLSACQTALGEHRDGEGLLSLARAFLVAGARSVAASLWRVDDLSTSELMIRFYRHLRAGSPKDEALRAAQIELLSAPIEVAGGAGGEVVHDFTAPYHWAAFQLAGDWR